MNKIEEKAKEYDPIVLAVSQVRNGKENFLSEEEKSELETLTDEEVIDIHWDNLALMADCYNWGLEAGFEAGQQDSKWISVKDLLPEDISILAYTGGLMITLTYLDGIYYTPDGNIWCNDVTHWMSLPQPPKLLSDDIKGI